MHSQMHVDCKKKNNAHEFHFVFCPDLCLTFKITPFLRLTTQLVNSINEQLQANPFLNLGRDNPLPIVD